MIRVITGGYDHKKLREGQPVRLAVQDYMVFEDDGMLEQILEIQT